MATPFPAHADGKEERTSGLALPSKKQATTKDNNSNEQAMTEKVRGTSVDLFTGLAHPLRRRILRAMMNDQEHATATPRKLADSLDEPLSVLSYHVKTLRECKAIRLVRTTRVRGATQHIYRLSLKVPWARTALDTTTD